ncbi:MAG: flagellar protein FlaG [Methylobacter sp.]|nr:flagellar protein FlaG [Methylobacter sp.]
MNSEITNVSKLVPVTVLRNKQNDLKVVSDNANAQSATVSEEGSKMQVVALKADAQETSLELVKSAVTKGNSILQSINRNLEFQVDDSTQKVVVKIVDSKSGDVVRQIPTEEMLAFIKRMQEMEGDQGTLLQDRV